MKFVSCHLPLPSQQLLEHPLIDRLIQEIGTSSSLPCSKGLFYQPRDERAFNIVVSFKGWYSMLPMEYMHNI